VTVLNPNPVENLGKAGRVIKLDGVEERAEQLVDLEIIQVVSTPFHLFTFRSSVVVLFYHSLADVGSVADDLVRHLAVEAVGDASTTNCVRTDTRPALVGRVALDGRTLTWPRSRGDTPYCRCRGAYTRRRRRAALFCSYVLPVRPIAALGRSRRSLTVDWFPASLRGARRVTQRAQPSVRRHLCF
jgi:hypothetical protein